MMTTTESHDPHFDHEDDADPVDGRYEVPASLDGPGIRFHGHRRHEVPAHVWQAIRDAAWRVLENYTQVGTPCGHAPSPTDENRCSVMICAHSTRGHEPSAATTSCWCARRTCRGCAPPVTETTPSP